MMVKYYSRIHSLVFNKSLQKISADWPHFVCGFVAEADNVSAGKPVSHKVLDEFT